MAMKRKSASKINPHILRYIEMVESGEILACEEQHLLVAYVRRCFETEDIYTDDEQLVNYLSLIKYFPYERLFEWEEFCLALHCSTYRCKDHRPRWPDLFVLTGRGCGKDGYIAYESFCVTSEYNGIPQYDVDICANNEDQAKAPFDDIYNVLETPEHTKKLRKFFHWNKEEINSNKTKSKIKYRTNSPKGKDGLRSGIVYFNEIHQYQDYANINVFTTGLGKKKHPRRMYATTNGDVRDGPLDHMLEKSEMILRGELPDNGLLPFICKLDKKEEVDDPQMWDKANPSLRYRPDLREEIEKEYREWKLNPAQLVDFMTKRMNWPQSNTEVAVTDYDKNIVPTKRPLPDMTGWSCTVGIDYAKINDWASVNFHFKKGEQRYDINHSWLCLKSKDLSRLHIPWKEWGKPEIGYITLVDDVEIHPKLLCDYISLMAQKYNILKIGIDNNRYALVSAELKKIGFDANEYKNVKLVRPNDIYKVQTVVDSCFTRHLFTWGDYPPLRWAVNNTKLLPAGKKEGTETGNFYYGKIEPKSRKTDPFMSVVHSMVVEDELETGGSTYDDVPVIVC